MTYAVKMVEHSKSLLWAIIFFLNLFQCKCSIYQSEGRWEQREKERQAGKETETQTIQHSGCRQTVYLYLLYQAITMRMNERILS